MKRAELAIMLFIIGVVGFNWPVIEIFNIGVAAYLFIFWFIFILLSVVAGFRSS